MVAESIEINCGTAGAILNDDGERKSPKMWESVIGFIMVNLSVTLKFLNDLYNLRTFPVFVGYLSLVFLSRYWKRICGPLEFRPLLVIYNFFCSAISGYTSFGLYYALWKSGTSIYSSEDDSMTQYFLKVYWMTKCIELFDTLFMILRHRQRQITFLHVYHHSSVLILSDYAYNFAPWPAVSFFLSLNSFVHVILYIYYGLSALNPGNPPQWRKLMTQIQIAQFVGGLNHAIQGYFYHKFCIWSIVYGVSMIVLFSNFYYKAYYGKKPPRTTNGIANHQKAN